MILWFSSILASKYFKWFLLVVLQTQTAVSFGNVGIENFEIIFDKNIILVGQPFCIILKHSLCEDCYISKALLQINTNPRDTIFSTNETNHKMLIYDDKNWEAKANKTKCRFDRFCISKASLEDDNTFLVWNVYVINTIKMTKLNANPKKTLKIYALPLQDPIINPKSSTINPDKKMNLSVVVDSVHPKPTIEWKIENDTLPSNETCMEDKKYYNICSYTEVDHHVLKKNNISCHISIDVVYHKVLYFDSSLLEIRLKMRKEDLCIDGVEQKQIHCAVFHHTLTLPIISWSITDLPESYPNITTTKKENGFYKSSNYIDLEASILNMKKVECRVQVGGLNETIVYMQHGKTDIKNVCKKSSHTTTIIVVVVVTLILITIIIVFIIRKKFGTNNRRQVNRIMCF